MSSITNIEILDKYYSSNDDTLFYIRNRDYQFRFWSDPSGYYNYNYYTETIFYVNLDSLLNHGNVDTVYTNINWYNGRIINYLDYSSYYITWNKKFVNGCGKTSEQIYDEELWVEDSYELVYYKKGNEEWGIPFYVSVEDINFGDQNILVYPNPADEIINFNFQNLAHNDVFAIEIRNLQSQLIKEAKNIQSFHYALNVADLKAGVYFYVIREQHKIVQHGKLIIK